MLFLNRKVGPESLLPNGAMPAAAFSWEADSYRPSEAMLLDPPVASDRRLCGSMECTATRVSPWRNRKRPVFEDQWGCSGRCVLSMVRAAVRREMSGDLESAPPRHNHRLPLGLLMLAQGWISHAQLQQALAAQRLHGGRIGDWLVAECRIDPERVTRGLSLQWSCPVLTPRGFTPAAMAMVAPKILIEEFGFVPLRVAGSKLLYLGFEDRLDASAALALEQMTELKVESGLLATEQYREVRAELLAQEGAPVALELIREPDALAARITALLEQKQPVGSRLVRMHKYLWLRLWLESASRAKKGTRPRDTSDMLDYVFTVGR
jgi:hypothetical protein